MPANKTFQILWWRCYLLWCLQAVLFQFRNAYSKFHIAHYLGCSDKKTKHFGFDVPFSRCFITKTIIMHFINHFNLQPFTQSDLWFRELRGIKVCYIASQYIKLNKTAERTFYPLQAWIWKHETTGWDRTSGQRLRRWISGWTSEIEAGQHCGFNHLNMRGRQQEVCYNFRTFIHQKLQSEQEEDFLICYPEQ